MLPFILNIKQNVLSGYTDRDEWNSRAVNYISFSSISFFVNENLQFIKMPYIEMFQR